MGIVAPITILLLHVAAVALDIIIVFIFARLLRARVSWKWLLAFDAVGRPLTDTVLSTTDRVFSNAQHGRLRESSALGLGLAGALLIRLLCSAIASAVN